MIQPGSSKAGRYPSPTRTGPLLSIAPVHTTQVCTAVPLPNFPIADAAREVLSIFSAVLTGDSGTDWDTALAALEYRRQYGLGGESDAHS